MVNDTLGANDHSSIENLDLAWNNLKTFFFLLPMIFDWFFIAKFLKVKQFFGDL